MDRPRIAQLHHELRTPVACGTIPSAGSTLDSSQAPPRSGRSIRCTPSPAISTTTRLTSSAPTGRFASLTASR